MNFNTEIKQLKNNLEKISSNLSSLTGQETVFSEQVLCSKNKIKNYDSNKKVYKKAIEFLTLVQESTKDKIKKGFEQIVIYALRFICNKDYKFELDFSRRGNLSELDFNIKAPDSKRFLDPEDTEAGGALNVLSLSLRIALLELMKPKVEGLLVWDEPFRDLSEEYLPNADKFIQAINKKINRQIILISHKKEFRNPENNLIKIGGGGKTWNEK